MNVATISVFQRVAVLCFAVLGFGLTTAVAYNPPADEAGPLRVRIEGPDSIDKTGQRIPVRVVLENSEKTPLKGNVRVSVIDEWTVEPAATTSFVVPAQGKVVKTFQVTAAGGTYAAQYPIHAFVEVEHRSQRLTAHPIFIVKADVSTTAPESTLPWKPVSIRKNSELALWQVPIRRAIVQVFGEEPQIMPVGWQGSEDRSRASLARRTTILSGKARDGFATHPPWDNGRVGALLAEYPLSMPPNQSISMRFANAIAPDGKSDGVTFRVRVVPWESPAGASGRVLYERHVQESTWQDAEVDLSAFAGQTIRLQLESHPGPAKNTGWDQGYWGEPTLIVGTPATALDFPPPNDEGSIRLGVTRCNSREFETRVWIGNRGLLDAVVAIDDGEQRLYFRGFQVTVLGARIDDMSSPIQLLRTEEEPAANGVRIRHWFSGPDGELQLMVWLGVEQGVLRSRFELEQAPSSQPWVHYHLEDVAIGAWSESIEMVYAGQGNVVKKPAAYTLPFDGHRLATSFVGYDFAGGISIIEAADVPPINLQIDPARDHGSLHVAHTQTRTIIPTDNVWQGVKVWRDTNELQASAGVSKAAGRFVFDIWGGRYAESRRDLKRALRYGLRDSMVVWHNWQRWGYDYRLPEIYPANPRYGLHEELQSMIEDCREEGVLFALHDNYIDYYPDAQGFSYKDKIAFHSDGTPVRAWLNKGREAQSYRYRADRVEPILKENLRLIRDGLKPDAYFIDVWSSARPYDYWTADGEFRTAVTTRDTWGKLFAWIRDYLGNDAPQISESGHDQLIGWLDGAQANHLRIGKPIGGEYSWSVLNWECEDAERIPWLDAAHHDRFVLHGAGYSSRYSAGLDPRLHGMYSDDYIVTEILTGHPAMASRPFDRNVVRKYWLTHDVLRALALRTIESVEFVDGDIHRQHVQWSGDGEVWVNRGETDWPLQGEVTLPSFGFLAKIPTADGMVTASIEKKQGLIVETAIAPHDAYFNGRQLADAQLPIRMSVQKMRELGEGRAELDLQWDARLPIPAGWSPFLHFCDNAGGIVFQASHAPRQFAENSKGKLTANASLSVPADVKDGQQLELLYGIYHPKTGRRLNLAGPDSGDGRIRLGHIEVRRENGETTVKWIPFDPGTDPFLTRQNPDDREVDFGMVQTSGAIRLTRSDEGVVVTPLPGAFVPNFTIQVQWDKLPWRLPFPQHIVAIDEKGSVLGDVQIKEGEGNRVVVLCQPNVFAYRLTSEKVTGED